MDISILLRQLLEGSKIDLNRMRKRSLQALKIGVTALLFSFLFNQSLFASSGSDESAAFDPGETIMHHVMDAHEIHITHGVHIPLPVIVKAKNGFDFFSFSFFETNERLGYPTYTSGSTGNTYFYDHGHIYLLDENNGVMTDAEGAVINEAPYDISITKNVAGMFLGIAIMFLIFLSVAKSYKRRQGQAPKGLQSLMEPLILFVRDEVAKPSIGRGYERFMPFLLTIFFFIWICNMLGLIPFLGGMNVTGNIAVTMVLATFTFVITSINANKGYWMHIVAPPGVPLWLLPIMIPVEILGVVSKPIVLMLRLFANITAGHIVLLSFASLIFIFAESGGVGAGYGVSIVSVAFSVFMNFLELLVAFLQAYVFTLLSALYFGMATEEAH